MDFVAGAVHDLGRRTRIRTNPSHPQLCNIYDTSMTHAPRQMKRTLMLLRHTKSDWQSGAADDHDRPLNARGQRAAAVIGAYLNQQGLEPDLVVASSAVRTRQTCDLVLRHSGFQPSASRERALYLASPNKILNLLHGQPADAQCVMIVGHNPGLQELAVALTEASGSDAAALRADFPTGALAIFETAEPWNKAGPGSLSLTDFTYPKALV